MSKLFLIKNPHTFQGEKRLTKEKKYFEGWYYKTSSDDNTIAFIPGISITPNSRKAFIQIITNKDSYYIDYDIEEVEYRLDPFYFKIANNIFSKDQIHIDIKSDDTKIFGNISYSNIQTINTSCISPNIMGPFSYFPFMECNHAIICMKACANGKLKINNKKITFNDSIGYIEKDWGISFPQKYIWNQANDFENESASFMISIADIPFKIFTFQGFICILKIKDHEYKFTTYNGAKIIKYKVSDKQIDIEIKKGKHKLFISSAYNNTNNLIAPKEGKMQTKINESIEGFTKITLKKDEKVIFRDISKNCGLEIVTT